LISVAQQVKGIGEGEGEKREGGKRLMEKGR